MIAERKNHASKNRGWHPCGAPEALIGFFKGTHTGKMLVKLAEDD